MQSLLFTAIMLTAFGGLAGIIYPGAIGCQGVKRWIIGAIGVVVLFALLLAIGMTSPEDGQTSTAELLVILLATLWPVWALVLLVCNRKHPDHAAPWLAASRTAAENKSPIRPFPKPNRTTRAIRTGWSMGDIEFTYEDSAGDISRRRVTVHSIDSTYIKGECHDRQAERTFRIDRIIGDLTDCETGEILNPRQWARKARA